MTVAANDRPRSHSTCPPARSGEVGHAAGAVLRPRSGFTVEPARASPLEHVDGRGMAETLASPSPVMYAWFMTVWTSNWLDADRQPVRLLLLCLMFASLVMSTSVAEAFGDRAGLFVTATWRSTAAPHSPDRLPRPPPAHALRQRPGLGGRHRAALDRRYRHRQQCPAGPVGGGDADHLRRRDRRSSIAGPEKPVQLRQPDLRRDPPSASACSS